MLFFIIMYFRFYLWKVYCTAEESQACVPTLCASSGCENRVDSSVDSSADTTESILEACDALVLRLYALVLRLYALVQRLYALVLRLLVTLELIEAATKVGDLAE